MTSPLAALDVAAARAVAALRFGQPRAMAHKLVDFVFSRPKGEIAQELGGVGVTVLLLAEAAGCSAEMEEAREVLRVLAKPLAHFKARTQAKTEAGFLVTSAAVDIVTCTLCGGKSRRGTLVQPCMKAPDRQHVWDRPSVGAPGAADAVDELAQRAGD